jgi:hypothetical protein
MEILTVQDLAAQMDSDSRIVRETAERLATLPEPDWGSPVVRAALLVLHQAQFQIQDALAQADRLSGVETLVLEQEIPAETPAESQ